MSIQDFVNVAGRAGRPGKDTEGQVIFIPDRIYRTSITRSAKGYEAYAIRTSQETALARANEYFFPPPNAFVVQSALQEIQLELETAASENYLPQLSVSAQTTLLALHAAGLIDAEDLERFFSSSLATIQLQRTASVGSIARIAGEYLADTIERNGEARVKRFSKTALSIDSCEALDRALRSLFEMGYDFSEPLRVNGRIDKDRIEPLIKAVLAVPQLRNNDYFPDENAATGAAELLSQWMNGASFTEMASNPRFGRKTEKVVDFLAAAADRLAWGLGSAYLLLELITEEAKEAITDWLDISFQQPLNPEFGLIPLYIEYGVNNATAAFLALLGISERETAQALANAFNSEQQIHQDFPSFETVERWMRSLTREKVSSFGSLRGYRVRVLYNDLNLREDGDATDERTGRTVSLTVQPRDATPSELEALIGELCFVRPSSTEKETLSVFELATRRFIGTLTAPSSRDYNQISPTNTRVYGVVLRHMLQQATSWSGFDAKGSEERRRADLGHLLVKVWT
jgi:hypothetical protein